MLWRLWKIPWTSCTEQTGEGIWKLSKNTIYIYCETKNGIQINDKNTVTKKQNLQHTSTIQK